MISHESEIILVIVALVNLVNSVVNIFWTNKLKSIQANKELMDTLIMQNKAKDEIIANKDETIREMLERKNIYKRQLHVQIHENKKREGKIEVLESHLQKTMQ